MELGKIRALILDMDGVLWRDTQPLGDPAQIFERFAAKGLRIAFATNNATRSVEDYVEKLASLGMAAEAAQIFTSGTVTAEYMAERHPRGGTVYIIGEDGLAKTLAGKGFSHGTQDVLAVIAALDRSISYEKLKTAALMIRRGVPLIGTNPDRTFPTPEGLAPGAGAMIAALEAAGGVEAEIIGKPQPTIFLQAMKQLGTEPGETLVVGDRLETDIAGGQAAGCRTALVLTGASTDEQARNWSPAPDLILPDLTALARRF